MVGTPVDPSLERAPLGQVAAPSGSVVMELGRDGRLKLIHSEVRP